MSAGAVAPRSSTRVAGVDVARALASLIMVQGHAYHAWVAEPARQSPAYLFTRLLGTLPLPAFLLLAGVGTGLRLRAAVRRGESAGEVRASLVRRGALIVLAGYASNIAFAFLDGAEGLATLLRADVLHVIGLSLVTLALFGARGHGGEGAPDLGQLRRAALALWIVPSLVCPWLSGLGAAVPLALRPLLAPFVDVPDFTRMPLVPLVGWLAIGALLGQSEIALPLRARTTFEARAGVRPAGMFALALVALLIALAANAGTEAWVQASGEALTRRHPAVVLNVVDFAARGALVLALGLGLAGVLPDAAGRWLARLGQSSLWIYLAHLPFCYGRPGKALFHSLGMLEATAWLVPLVAFSVAVGLARTALRERPRLAAGEC